MDLDKPKYGKVWAKGYYDGIRCAFEQIDKEGWRPMNSGRYKSIMNGLSSMAKKVYESVPIVDYWTVHQVVSDMKRKYGALASIDKDAVLGCLNTLVESKVVHESENRTFKRVPVIEEKKKPKEIIKDEKMDAVIKNKHGEEPTNLGPLDRIAGITSKLRELADAIDDELLNVEKEMNDEAQKYKKLNQLQELLKSI